MSLRQRGVAIVLALGVVALAAMVATAMMVTQSTWARQIELTADHVQARVLVRVGMDWTRALLSDDKRASNVDHLGEPWALQLPAIPLDNGSLAGRIEDQQGKFNLNNLVREGQIDLVQLEHFRRLLSLLGLPPALAEALADWMDADNEAQPGGAEDEVYLALQPPYLTANRPLIDLSELALVRGFDDKVRLRLGGFVSALPVFTAVNANTAAPEVMAAVIDGLTLEAAKGLIEERKKTYFRDRADFLSRLPAGMVVTKDELGFNSDYFLVQVRVTIGTAQSRGAALLARTNANWPSILWQKIL